MNCKNCNSKYVYEDKENFVCPECGNEWPQKEDIQVQEYKDSNGNLLESGDTIVVIKDLKIKGSSGIVKQGTKVKNIRLKDDEHDIDCKIDGIGKISLKSEFVRKI